MHTDPTRSRVQPRCRRGPREHARLHALEAPELPVGFPLRSHGAWGSRRGRCGDLVPPHEIEALAATERPLARACAAADHVRRHWRRRPRRSGQPAARLLSWPWRADQHSFRCSRRAWRPAWNGGSAPVHGLHGCRVRRNADEPIVLCDPCQLIHELLVSSLVEGQQRRWRWLGHVLSVMQDGQVGVVGSPCLMLTAACG